MSENMTRTEFCELVEKHGRIFDVVNASIGLIVISDGSDKLNEAIKDYTHHFNEVVCIESTIEDLLSEESPNAK